MIDHPLYRRGLLALTVITALVFLVMAVIIFARLGGLALFDLRTGGYSKSDAQALLTALGARGDTAYRSFLHPIDSVFPALLALTISGWALLLAKRLHLTLFITLPVVLIALLAAVADYIENDAVYEMFRLGAANIDDELVMTASYSTVTKLICDDIALFFVIVCAFTLARRRRSSRMNAN